MSGIRLSGTQRGPPVLAVAILAASLAVGLLLVAPPARAASAPALTPCPGPQEPTGYSGLVEVAGGPAAPTLGDDQVVHWAVSMERIVVNLTTGDLVAESCPTIAGNATVNATGAFAFSSAIAPSCTGTQALVCTAYTGAYGNLTLAPTVPAPVGYTIDTEIDGPNLTVAYAAVVGEVAVGPTFPTVVGAPDAPIEISATAETGIGTPCPVPVDFTWGLTGAGWSFDAPSSSGATVNLTAAPGTPNATLSVAATGLVDGDAFGSSTTTVSVAAVATAPSGGQIGAAEVDVGAPVAVAANATGAPRLSYFATFDPGLGLPPDPMPCATAPRPNGTEAIACSVVYAFPFAGSFAPNVTIANPYSTAVVALPGIVAVPPPTLVIAGAPVGEVDRGVGITVEARAGTGTGPFQGACLADGIGDDLCAATGGPAWTFWPTYRAAGTYGLRAWAVDADGINRSADANVTVEPALALSLPTPVVNGTAGDRQPVTADVAGGVLPATYWLNASDGAPVATGPIPTDGPLDLSVVPAAPGSFRYALTVVDGAGAAASGSVLVVAGAPPAATVRASLGATVPATEVGTPVAVAWQAFEPDGAPAPAFAAAATLEVTGPTGASEFAAWVNVTGLGPLAPTAVGSYAVPADAWAGGVLRLTVAPAAAGPFALALAGPGLPGPVPPAHLEALPDLDRLVLSDPRSTPSPAGTNATEWTVTDRYGDPVPGASVSVAVTGPGTGRAWTVPATVGADGRTDVWVNYSLAGGGTVRVYDAAGELLLGPTVVPAGSAPAATGPATLALGVAVAVGAGIGAVTAGIARRRARPATPPPIEEALRRLADGRADVVELVGRLGPATRDEIAAAWDPPPAPPELDEWIASLVTDGTLVPGARDDGTAALALGPEPAGRDPPSVELDPEALERAIARREAEARDAADP
ncbi:MAG TPA: hypothetical protein VMG99_07630 [Thermoplasmata archaeon]|nr:hypothetical protein [Thermoplasmata archaeon]